MKKLFFAALALASLGLHAGLREKVYKFMPLHSDLSVASEDGTRSQEAVFTRESPALTPDFKSFETNKPRFFNGGLLIENGGKTIERGAWNFIPAGTPFLEGGKTVAGIHGDALEFSGSQTMKAVPFKIGGAHVFSFYAKGKGTLSLTPLLNLKSGTAKKLPAAAFPLTSEWRRFHVSFSAGNPARDADPALSFSGSFQTENAAIGTAMLEGPCVYFQTLSPSTYIPNGAFRAADKLKLPVLKPEQGMEGAFSFVFEPTAQGWWQALLSVGGGWKTDMELSYNVYSPTNTRFTLQFRGKKMLTQARLELGRKYHLLVNYTKDGFSLWLDGKKLGEEKAPGAPFTTKDVFLGSRDIEIKSNGLFSNFTIFKAPLDDAEIKELFQNADLMKILPAKEVASASPFAVFPVNAGVCTLLFDSIRPVASVELRIGSFKTGTVEVAGNRLTCRFDPALLMPGGYALELACRFADGATGNFSFPVKVVHALRPWENVQVNAWNEFNPEFENSGVTIAGSGLEAHKIDALAEKQFYGNYNLNYFGIPRPGSQEDLALDSSGKELYPDIRSDFLRKDIAAYGRKVGESIQLAPTFKAIVLNSEHHAGGAGNWANFSPREIQRARSFGLDLEKWRLKGNKANESFWKFMPMGYLGASIAPELIPDSRAIPADNPLYAYLLDHHAANGGSEVVINDLLAEAILKVRPDLMMMQDPVMRRPALRSYEKINVAQDWFYYTELSVIVNGVEGLGAVRRGFPEMTTSTMPQFLFKEGMAAPFAGMPPRDMFREACWIAASRPMRVISFWNTGNAFIKGKQMTADEIRNLLGDSDYARTAKAMKEKKENPFCFDPRLKKEFRSLSDSLWVPFGALLPKWENAPRKLAVVRSFASDLFGNVRWPNAGALGNAAANSGYPFDILLDADLEKGIGDYDVIVLPDCSALPERGVENLREILRRGGTVVADDRLKVKGLDGVQIIRSPEKWDESACRGKEQEVLRQSGGRTDTPAYIEAMEELQKEADKQKRMPGLDELLRKRLKTTFSTSDANLFWNHLRAEGAQYLFVVNDLRIPGEIYGRFGKVREQGVARKVSFHVHDPKLRYAFNLTAQCPIPVKNGEIALELPPSGGNIILFTEKQPGSLAVSAEKDVRRGKHILVKLSLENGSGLIPVNLELFLPDGTRSSLSRWNVLKNGSLAWEIAIPLNAPAGDWRIRAAESATGQVKTFSFRVTP